MKLQKNKIINYALVILLTFIIGGFQTTFWPQTIGSTPSPMMWLPILVYIALYRNPISGIFFIYFLGLIISSFTVTALKMIWLNELVIFLFCYLVRRRVFWSGPSYFVIITIFSSFLFQFSFVITSYFLEDGPASFSFFLRAIQVLLTPLFSYPIYILIKKIDSMTQLDRVTLPIESKTL